MLRRFTLIAALAGALVSSHLLSGQADARVRRFLAGKSLSQQKQYPKSMRTRGLKQLGAVPAMGGVRSLPFWGGER